MDKLPCRQKITEKSNQPVTTYIRQGCQRTIRYLSSPGNSPASRVSRCCSCRPSWSLSTPPLSPANAPRSSAVRGRCYGAPREPASGRLCAQGRLIEEGGRYPRGGQTQIPPRICIARLDCSGATTWC